MDILSNLANLFLKRVCIVGVGNYLKGDDSVGLYMLDRLIKSLASADVEFINAEDIIESYIFKIIEKECKNVLIIDAVFPQEETIETGSAFFSRYGEEAGTFLGFSTHKLSLSMSCKILEKHGISPYLLGIVPENIDFGSVLSKKVQKTADILIEMILSLKSRQ